MGCIAEIGRDLSALNLFMVVLGYPYPAARFNAGDVFRQNGGGANMPRRRPLTTRVMN